MFSRFADRREAGRALAAELARYAGRRDLVVLALPRGGVPVAAEVARALGAPMDVFVVRKLGAPGYPELALGAIASGGLRVIDPSMVRLLRVRPEEVERIAREEGVELERRERAYRVGHAPLPVAGRTVILVDDGLATGASMMAAIAALRQSGATAIVVAVPVAARQSLARMRRAADDVVAVATPEPFFAVGLWYDDFTQTTDDEVRALLDSGAPALATTAR
ncbi:MAG TPA: phosphoribosyltransferase [Gemmatimonadaceae bacterium]